VYGAEKIIRKGEKIMTITRDEMVRKLSAKTGYNMKDIREVLRGMDEVVFEELGNVTPDNEVAVQLVQGVKLVCEPVEERLRKDPRNQNDITCNATCKVKARISQDIKLKMQEIYDHKHNKNG
jgi:nucleoid DNA-binding protein